MGGEGLTAESFVRLVTALLGSVGVPSATTSAAVPAFSGLTIKGYGADGQQNAQHMLSKSNPPITYSHVQAVSTGGEGRLTLIWDSGEIVKIGQYSVSTSSGAYSFHLAGSDSFTLFA